MPVYVQIDESYVLELSNVRCHGQMVRAARVWCRKSS